ncbi:MAG: hypothetical protein R3C52_05465 [Hyphomonadaceae bacterium]
MKAKPGVSLLVVSLAVSGLVAGCARAGDAPAAEIATAVKAPTVITVMVEPGGRILWEGEELKPHELQKRAEAAALGLPQPEVRIVGGTPYAWGSRRRIETCARMLRLMYRSGFTEVGVTSESLPT